ncbi:hypothetical protein HMPREF9969_2004 [Prevotella sp. oral taxon 306 str. F0472]|nr:hypothetical protein HMPREF9969_2004 [Prevotella sp. oral taxon 306 str. F0472]
MKLIPSSSALTILLFLCSFVLKKCSFVPNICHLINKRIVSFSQGMAVFANY